MGGYKNFLHFLDSKCIRRIKKKFHLENKQKLNGVAFVAILYGAWAVGPHLMTTANLLPYYIVLLLLFCLLFSFFSLLITSASFISARVSWCSY